MCVSLQFCHMCGFVSLWLPTRHITNLTTGLHQSLFHSHTYSLTTPGQTRICSMSVQLHYFASHEWDHAACTFARLFHSLSIISLEFIQFVACIDSLFLFISKWYSMVLRYHRLFNNSPIEGYVGYFYFGAPVNKAAINLVQVSTWK